MIAIDRLKNQTIATMVLGVSFMVFSATFNFSYIVGSPNDTILTNTHTNVLKVGLFYLCLSSSQDSYNFPSLNRRLEI
jgi:hypothetical protein